MSAIGSRRRPRWIAALAVVVVLLVVAHLAIGWILAGRIDDEALRIDDRPSSLDFDVKVLAVTGDSFTYSTKGSDNSHLRREGTYGVAWVGGFGIAGNPSVVEDDGVTRPLDVRSGRLTPGSRVDLLGAVFASDPLAAHGLAYTDVRIPSELGVLDAWHVAGATDAWVIFVHGRTTPRTEALRILPVVHAGGYHALVISYRGDPGQPADPGGRYSYGRTEYRDVEAAIEYAQTYGARQIVLFGFSMGGALVVRLLLDSALAPAVAAAVLDAPLLDLESTIDQTAHGVRVLGLPLPGSLLASAKWMASQRFGFEWSDYDLTNRFDALRTPLLVLHGSDDDRVPIANSERLAAARPDLVQFERFEGAGHVLSWNIDPERYEGVVGEFLAQWLS